MDILFLLFIFILGFIAGWFRASKAILDKLLSDPKSMISLLEKYKEAKEENESTSDSKEVRKLKVERHGEMLYLFAEDTDEFLAQGKSLQEALAIIEKRFPNKTFIGHLDKTEADTLGITVK